MSALEPVKLPVAVMVVYLPTQYHVIPFRIDISENFPSFCFYLIFLIGAVWVGSGLVGAEERKCKGRVANRSRRYCKTFRRFLYVSATVQMYAKIRNGMVNCIVSYIFMRKFMLFHAVVSTYDFTLSKWHVSRDNCFMIISLSLFYLLLDSTRFDSIDATPLNFTHWAQQFHMAIRRLRWRKNSISWAGEGMIGGIGAL